ncbi:MAG: hypothetical protein HYX68_04210 [Planctomycetes bacterium]|nr:hypothetical protein [Planctomycetota bacterium]
MDDSIGTTNGFAFFVYNTDKPGEKNVLMEPDMNAVITLPPPVLPAPPRSESKWQREYSAFQRLLPQLILSHRGKYVAIHDETVVDVGDDKLALALRVPTRIGNVDIHVARVTDEPSPIARSGVRRENLPGGPA